MPTGWRGPPGPGIKEKRIRLEILTLGHDIATVNLEFKARGKDLVGAAKPDLGPLPRRRLEGDRRPRLDNGQQAALVK